MRSLPSNSEMMNQAKQWCNPGVIILTRIDSGGLEYPRTTVRMYVAFYAIKPRNLIKIFHHSFELTMPAL